MTLLRTEGKKRIAYFTMEIGLKDAIPTYSGGLGVLAGDTIKSMADLSVNAIAVTLLYRKGYFKQSLASDGTQSEEPVAWNIEDQLQPTPYKMSVEVEGREVQLKAWRHDVEGVTGHKVPVYFIDADNVANDDQDRKLTDHLYGGEERYRLSQEVVLGMGGIDLIKQIESHESESEASQWKFHMNEGHAALLTLGLFQNEAASRGLEAIEMAKKDGAEILKKSCAFTTHTPVPAGHDSFNVELAESILGENALKTLEILGGVKDNRLNMTYVALSASGYTNGVAMKHGEVSRDMFPGRDIQFVTNGIHANTWITPAMKSLFDREIQGWDRDNHYLRQAIDIPLNKLDDAHQKAKIELIDEVKAQTGVVLDPNVYTIGFARRAATYKRLDLIFDNVDELNRIAKKFGGLQLVFSGKAHPKDQFGKQLIKNVFERAKDLGDHVKFVFLPNYNMKLGLLLTGGVDVWLNNPIKPLEASGTSGMKSALNGVPSFSTLDGWWVEGHFEGVTGWEIKDEHDGMAQGVDEKEKTRVEAGKSLISTLENAILPLYYEKHEEYLKIMRNSICLNGSYFNTQRMVEQYLTNAYA